MTTSEGEPTTLEGLFRLAAGTAGLQICNYGLMFLAGLALARFVGRAGYGVYALATSWAALLAFPAILGFDRFLVRGLTVYHESQEWSLGRGLLLRANHLVLGTSLLIGGTAAGICFLCCSPALRIAMPIAMILIPMNNLVQLRQGAMQAFNRVVQGQIPEYLTRPILILAGIVGLHLLARSALTPVMAIAVVVAATCTAFIVGAVWLMKSLPAPLKEGSTAYQTRHWVGSAIPMMLVASFVMINNQTSILLVGAIDGHSAAGVFNVAETGANITALVLTASLMPLAPELARLYVRGDIPSMERAARHVARWALVGSIPVACAFASVPDLLLGMFGTGFKVGASALVIMALAQMANAAAGPTGNVLLMTGHERLAAVGVLCGMIANLMLGAVLIPVLGVTGGAIAEASSTIIWNLVMLWLVRQAVGINAAAFGPRLAV